MWTCADHCVLCVLAAGGVAYWMVGAKNSVFHFFQKGESRKVDTFKKKNCFGYLYVLFSIIIIITIIIYRWCVHETEGKHQTGAYPEFPHPITHWGTFLQIALTTLGGGQLWLWRLPKSPLLNDIWVGRRWQPCTSTKFQINENEI